MKVKSRLKHILENVKLRTWIALGVLLVLLPIAILTLFKPAPSQANWFNDSWGFRTSLTFTHNASVTSATKVKFDIDTATLVTAGKLQSDCGDSRFTDVNGKELPYYIDTAGGACNGASTDYYVLIPTILNGTNTIYHYYGNPNAANGTQIGQFTESTTTPSGGAASAGSEEKGTGPVGLWHFDEAVDNRCSGGTNDACDSTMNKLDGAISNGTAWKTPNMCVAGNCLYFDGSDDVVTVSNANAIDLDLSGGLLSGFTIEMWIRANGAGEGTGGQMFFKGTNTWFKVTNLSSGVLDLSASVDEATDATVTASAAVIKDRWTHVALSYNDDADDEITIWVNGVAVASSTNGVGPLASDANSLLIGGTTTNNFAGFIDEFKIYNFEKSSSQMKTDILRASSSDSLSIAVSSENNSKVLSDGLAGYWKLDESSGNAADSSGNATTLTNTAVTVYTGAKFGNGADFESSSSQYESAADNATLSITGSLTLAAWIRPESVSAGTYNIIAKWDGSNESYRLMQNGDEIRLELDSSGNYAETTAVNLSASTYYHVIGVYDSVNRTASIYINGELTTSSITGTIPSSIGDDAGKIHIGAEDSSTSATGFYDGYIDDARIYNRAFSSSEARNLYDWAAPPIGWWQLDENTGTTTYDRSTNASNGTLTNGPVWTTGVYGPAVKFDGTDDIITMGAPSVLDLGATTDSYTVEGWIRPAVIGTQRLLLRGQTGFGSSDVAYRLGINSAGNAFFDINDSVNNPTTGASDTDTAATANVLYHLTGVRDVSTDTLRIYINGVLADEDTDTTTASCQSAQNVQIGGGYGASFVNGMVDDVRIYNYVRTQGQIIEDMNGGHPLGGSPIGTPIAYWKLDEQRGTTVNSTSQTSYTTSITEALWRGKNNCKVNGCLDFDGSNDVLTVTSNTALDFDDDLHSGFSISAWINPDTVGEGSAGQIFVKNTSTYCQLGGTTPFNLTCSVNAGTDATLTVNSVIPVSTWTHIVLTWSDDSDDELTIYVNGKSYGSSTNGVGPLDTDAATSLLIGGGTANNFDGKIDEFRVYNVELSPEEVKSVYNAGASLNVGVGTDEETVDVASATYPILVWNLNENTGTTANDTSGNGLSGTLTNTPTWVPGKYGAGVNFAGSNQHITKSDDPTLDFIANTSFTIETWFKHKTATATETLVSKMLTSDNDGGYKLKMESDGDITCETDDDDADTTIDDTATTTAATYDDDTWHHVACVYDTANTDMYIYIDGVLVASDTTTTTNSLANDEALFYGIESATGTEDWIGQLDELTIYNYARSQAQVAYDYNRGGPVGWWKLDDCSGTTINNAGSGGSTINGTLTIGASGTSAVGTCTSSGAWLNGVSGKFNSSIDLDGTDDQISVTDNDLVDFGASQDFTVSAWVKTTQAASSGEYPTIVHKNPGGGSANGYQIGLHDSTNDSRWFAKILVSGTGYTAYGATDVADGEWHNLMLVRSGSNIYSYEDGRLANTTAASSATIANSTALKFGYTNFGSPFDYWFNGQIDDIRLYRYALSQPQIRKLYNDGAAIYFGPQQGTPSP